MFWSAIEWLDRVREVKCSSFGTIGGLAFLHQDGHPCVGRATGAEGILPPPTIQPHMPSSRRKLGSGSLAACFHLRTIECVDTW